MDGPTHPPKKVLIVEDDMLLSLVEERLIEKMGHKVIGKVESGEEAIKKNRELKPDLILMDIVLKGEIDGIQAMEKIRESSDVPVIYLSGNSDRFNYERAKKTGFTEYLVKPVSSNDLIKPLDLAFGSDKTAPGRDVKDFKSESSQLLNKSA